jgi:hypothetical protein
MEWNLQGLDAACLAQGPDAAVPLSCGLHIHEGTSCEVGTGDHFYDRARFTTGSAWLPSQYVHSAAAGQSHGSVVNLYCRQVPHCDWNRIH